jgi:phosphatidylglycerol:prolipoprotein diacylglycerol transferase
LGRVHPIAFSVFGFPVYWYGIFAAIGFVSAFSTAARRAPREGLSGDAIMNLAPWIIGGAIIGARLLYVLTFWKEQFAGQPIYYIVTVGRHGFVFYGGLIGACLGTIIYCWRGKYPLWKVADIMAPSVALGHGFGRIGCFMTGCCFGRPTDLPWAVHFPPGGEAPVGVGLHPTQIYEALLNFTFSFVLLALYRRKKFDGQIFAIYLLGYAILRAFVEMFRGDYDTHYFGVLTPGQMAGVIIFSIGIALWIWLARKGAALRPAAPAQTHG